MSCTVRNHAGRGVWPNPGWRGAIDPEPRGQAVEKRAVLRDIVAAVQEQQRRAGSGNLGVDRDAADVDAFHPRLHGLSSRLPPALPSRPRAELASPPRPSQ